MPLKSKNIKTKKKSPSSPSDLYLPGIGDLNEPPKDFMSYASVIYGLKGNGKTTLISQLSPKSLVFMFEPRRRNLAIRMVQLQVNSVVQMEQGASDDWQRFKQLVAMAQEDDSIDHIGIDTVDRCYKACMNSVCKEMGIEHPGGLNDFGAAWNAVKEEFRAFFDELLSSDTLGVTFISHCSEMPLEINTGETVTTYGPSCDNFVKEYLKQACDFAFFYGKHYSRRAMHVRWTPDIWTACGNDSFFLKDGEKIAAFEIPEAESSGQVFLDAFNCSPSSKVLKLYSQLDRPDDPTYEDEEEETPAKKPRKKFKKS